MLEPVILIVDDNLDNLKLLSDMLGKQGYKTRRAISGKLALQALNATNFDLVLLDITMPDMNGYELCQKIKETPKFADIPIIFISALNSVADKVKAFDTGGVDYVSKPFQIEEVTARVANQLRIVSLQRDLQQLNQQLDRKNQLLKLEHKSFQSSQARIINNSLKDPITNLNQKQHFMGQLRKTINQAHEASSFDYLLIVISYEQFKLSKSILSLEDYTQNLIEIGKRINKLTPENGINGKLEENEFAIVFQDVDQHQDIISITEQVNSALSGSFKTSKHELHFNPNYGIVSGAQHYQNPETLLHDARIALANSMVKGYGKYQLFNSAIKQKTLQQLELQSCFRATIRKKGLNFSYCPLADSAGEKIEIIRTKVAWKYSQDRTINLEELAQIAKTIGLMSEFNHSILSTAYRRLKDVQEALLWNTKSELKYATNFKLCLSLSTEQFLDLELPKQLAATIQENKGVEKEGFVIEFPAKILVMSLPQAIANIRAIQQLGIRLIPDRAGVNYLKILERNNIFVTPLTNSSSTKAKSEATSNQNLDNQDLGEQDLVSNS